MTRAELRAVLTDFRAMVRARGPEDCLRVAAVRDATVGWTKPFNGCWIASGWHTYDFRCRLPRLAARAALRWWRWANRCGRAVQVAVYCDDYYVHSIPVWPSDH